MKKILISDHEKCTGCGYCVLVCSMAHEEVVQRSKSLVQVYKCEDEAIGIPMMCEHCDNPSCILVCPVKAISKDPETGVVSIDAHTCTGCGLCIEFCPYSAIWMFPDKKNPSLCNLCGGDPICAKVCFKGAIEWVDAVPSAIRKKKECADKRAKELKRILEVC